MKPLSERDENYNSEEYENIKKILGRNEATL